jgi:hypothetical protein
MMESIFIELLLRQYGVEAKTTIPEGELGLDETMDYADVEIMAFQLSLQLQHLEAIGFSLLFWEPSAILVVAIRPGLKLYVLSNLTQLVSLQKKDETQLVLVYPAVYPLPSEWCAPELLTIDVLPFITPRSASYYSLGLLCLRVLNLSLETLRGTKLFYFLERCMKAEPKERLCLYL